MFYFKKLISYFAYYELGEKKKNCGHSKILVKDQEVTIEIHIKGLGAAASCMCEIYATGEKRSQLGRFVLDKGTGYYNACFHGGDMDGQGLSVFEMTGLYIHIDENKYCEANWSWGEIPQQYRRISAEPEKTAMPQILEDAEPEGVEQENISLHEQADQKSAEILQETETGEEADSIKENTHQVTQAENGQEAAEPSGAQFQKETVEKKNTEVETVLHKSQMEVREIGIPYKNNREEMPLQERLHEDKWKQLCCLYPVCHPFGEDEEYISIAPKDFVILRKEYQNLVSNSFLLHSFYNYHHVILGKTGDQADEVFYIGAPGAYLEREKRVAVMFGFEGFALSERGNRTRAAAGGTGRPDGGIETGAFGYYMRKVEI